MITDKNKISPNISSKYIHNSSSTLPNISQKPLSLLGFTLVELITTITIVVVFSIVGITVYANILENSYNSSKVSHLNNLTATIKSYSTVNSDELPPVDGNKQYYSEDGTYSHYSTGAYGVSGFMTERSIPRYNSSNIPRDPKIGGYYAYGKTLTPRHTQKTKDGNLNENEYQLATVLNNEGIYKTYIKGNYTSNIKTTSLVKEYNGPGMVINNTSNHLPYNPKELKLTGQIISFSGKVIVGNTQIDTTNIQEILIRESDKVTISTGGLATIRLGDGSELKIGSQTKLTEIILTNLQYTTDSNLITKTIINLSFGEVWVKAPELEKDSEYVLQTDTAAASVRGTVFGMEYSREPIPTKRGLYPGGKISLISGKIELTKAVTDHSNFFEGVPVDEIDVSDKQFINFYKDGDKKFVMKVKEGQKPIDLNFCFFNTSMPFKLSGTGNISPEKIQQVNSEQVSLKESYVPKISSIRRDSSGSLFITTDIRDADSYEAVGWNGEEGNIFTGIINKTNSGLLNTKQEIMIGGTGAFSNTIEKLGLVSFRLCKSNLGGSNLLFNKPDESSIKDFPRITEDFVRGLRDKTIYYRTKLTRSDYIDNASGGSPIPTSPSPIGSEFQIICSNFSVPQGFGGEQVLAEPECPTGQSPNRLTRHCEEPGLVAFAGFDEAYDKDQTTHHLKRLKPEEDDSYPVIQDVKGFINAQSGSEIGPGMSSASSVVDYSGLLETGGLSGQIMKLKNGITGVHIPTGFTGNYIKYDLRKLQLRDNFAIEMSVRGGALKRSDGTTHQLLYSVGGGDFILKRSYTSGNYKLCTNTFCIPDLLIVLGQIPEDRFLKIRVQINIITGTTIIIKDDAGNIIYKNDLPLVKPKLGEELYIGSSNLLANQWNDIIDYVKIYKN